VPQTSAGLLMYRVTTGDVEVLLVHPGGPFWANKDDGAWSLPKGEVRVGEDVLEAARREFTEETGFAAGGPFLPLAPVRYRGGKVVHAWALPGDCDPAELRSNRFSLEWPPGSGRQQEFPEADRAAWFRIPLALRKILPAQQPIISELLQVLSGKPQQ